MAGDPRIGGIAVVIPAFKVQRHILNVLEAVGPEVGAIYVIDDCCPEGSGRLVKEQCRDPRVAVIYHAENLGVGAATMTGYQAALQDGAEIIVKIDGDGQMDPAMVPRFVAPIAGGKADYTKGNRFVELAGSSAMPAVRIVGNTLLSFLSKLSSGYWFLFDPTNGFTAIHSAVARALPAAKLSKSFFFESDMLFRLGLLGAVVYDIPMAARYGDEESRLRVLSVIPEFIVKHVRNALKRVFYQYFLWDFGIASVELVLGLLLFGFGLIFGIQKWVQSASMGVVTPAGTVMLAALPVLLGVQMLLGFLGFDMARRPRAPLWIRLVSSVDGGARVGSDTSRAATGPPRDK